MEFQLLNLIDQLLSNFWILRQDQPDLYRKIIRNQEQLRKILRDRFGLTLILHSAFAQVPVVPIKLHDYMGITEFSDQLDYVLLMCALAFTEDKNEDEPFLLSELVEEIELNLPDSVNLDWTSYRQRLSLVRVIKKMVDLKLLIVIEGEIDGFLAEENTGEVLYKISNLSRYFLGLRLESYEDYPDFTSFYDHFLADRPKNRSQEVLIQLMTEPIILRTEENKAEFEYLRQQQNFLERFFVDQESSEDQIYQFELTQNTALLLTNSRRKRPGTFPSTKMIDEILLELAFELHGSNLVKTVNDFGQLILKLSKWEKLIQQLHDKYHPYWSKEYREKKIKELSSELLIQGENNLLLQQTETQVIIFPSFARLIGNLGGNDDRK